MANLTTYTKKPRTIAEYTMMRGVTDFTNAAQFNLFETGYSFLTIITTPKFMEMLAKENDYIRKIVECFNYILEYEFRGLDGIEDITVDNIEVTDGISSMNTIGKVNQQSATEISMSFTEKSGTVITKYIDLYLRGVKDPRTQAKTYHGLIKNGKLHPGFENEVFNFLYMVTDNTFLGLEKAYLLVNAYPNKAPTNIFNSTKGEIDKREIDVTFQCFVIDGEEVNKRAVKMLAYINEANAVKNYSTLPQNVINDGNNKPVYNAVKNITSLKTHNDKDTAGRAVVLNSSEFQYEGFDSVDQVYNDTTNA